MQYHKNNIFDPAGTAITATANSSNVLVTGGSKADIGVGNPNYVFIQVGTAFASGGSTTLVVTVEASDDEAFTSPVTLITTATIAKASLVSGYTILNQAIPKGSKKYLRVKYTVGTGPFTAGNVIALLLPSQPEADLIYPDAF